MGISLYVTPYFIGIIICIYEEWDTYEETPHINIKDKPHPHPAQSLDSSPWGLILVRKLYSVNLF